MRSGCGFVVLLALGAARLLLPPRARPEKTQARGKVTVAVLPFRNLSSNRSDGILAAWLTKEVNNTLAKTDGFEVIPIGRNQTRPDVPSPEQLARQNHAQAVVEGAITRSGDKIEVTIQLLDASTGRMISTDEFERNSDAGNAPGNDVVRLISDSVRHSLLPNPPAP